MGGPNPTFYICSHFICLEVVRAASDILIFQIPSSKIN